MREIPHTPTVTHSLERYEGTGTQLTDLDEAKCTIPAKTRKFPAAKRHGAMCNPKKPFKTPKKDGAMHNPSKAPSPAL